MIFPSQGAVIVKDKMWPKNSTLAVVFVDGTESQKALVKKYAPEWIKGTSLQFKFYDNPKQAPTKTHIRVGFHSHNGSELGNHGDYVSKEATLLLNGLNDQSMALEYQKRLILHEFGHALGLEHEYRSPNWPYGKETIDEHIKECVTRIQSIGYAPEEAQLKCTEINKPLKKAHVKATVYDEFSIMNYPQTIKINSGSYKRITAKSELSYLDQLAIQQWYSDQ